MFHIEINMISKKRKEKITRHGYECTSVSHTTPELAQIFLEFGRDYMNDVLSEKREKFLQSILDLQGQPDRWLLLFKMGDEYIGFTHMTPRLARPMPSLLGS